MIERYEIDPGESMFLAVVIIVSIIMFSCGAFVAVMTMKKDIIDTHRIAGVKAEINDLLYTWLQNKLDNKRISDYFIERHINKIAVYGFGDLGERFVDDLSMGDRKIHISYIIDKDADMIETEYDVITPDAVTDDVDAIVVTPIQLFHGIKEYLSKRVNCEIISLEDVINGI